MLQIKFSLKGGDKAMKKSPWRLSLLLAVVIVALIALGFVYATGNKAQENEKAAVTSETHGHQEGSAECTEAHESGKCTGHEQGSPECIEAHISGECTGNCEKSGKCSGSCEKK
jgi:hypothetical protein